MAQYDDTTKMLMDIKEDVATTKAKVDSIEDKLNQVDNIEAKSDKALAKSIEVEHEIGRVTQIQNWVICLSTLVGVYPSVKPGAFFSIPISTSHKAAYPK
ncbi:hypothetical protein C6Y08_12835 [Lactiplantibacillus pentosus]|uniref:Uncharacterized protein n=1 Tax=Lactiplantibacillus pentosus TaxID=1589 RepID=A0ABX5CXB0_LACPE|nr:hemolysin XhlA family protein [Lactiplantibacillus pentosus]PRO93566.1 hypothetical protein C6Y08_12835 [Lactiplantibacillus pentosus]